MSTSRNISENSGRVALNTLMLYFRMLLLLLIGLYTSRVVLASLGIDDFGLYETVATFVTLFTVISGAISSAISRYLTFELGKGDMRRMSRIFSTGMLIQLFLCALLFLLTETYGLWHLHHVTKVPEGRMGAADWVLQCSMGVLMLNLLSVPYNATIIARERMSAFAFISILEAVLKLAVALLIRFSSWDKLKLYAALLLLVALVVRGTYTVYCRKRFEESRSGPSYDAATLREMSGFAGWNLLGSGAYVVNTHGVNQLVNFFFGVAVNSARGIALRIETIVRQFVTNFLTALNPQITKAYATGDKEYSFALANKGAKFSFLIIWSLALPLCFEADFLLGVWLVEVPQYASIFLKLSVFVAMVDLICAPFVTLELATGDIKRFYIAVGCIALTVLPVSWLLFRAGCPPLVSYVVFLVVYVLVDVAKMLIMSAQTGFDLRRFLSAVLLPSALVAAYSLLAIAVVWRLMPDDGWPRLLVILAVSGISIIAGAWFFALTDGEKSFIMKKLARR